MRILFTTINATSHMRALAPIAHAARDRGHDVAIAGPPAMADEVSEYALAFHPVGRDWAAATSEAMGRQLAFNAHTAYTDTLVNEMFLGEPPRHAAADICALADQ